jgi:hypothetical protein
MRAQYAVERIVHRITILTASAEDFVSTFIFGATKLTSTVDKTESLRTYNRVRVPSYRSSFFLHVSLGSLLQVKLLVTNLSHPISTSQDASG